MSARYLPKKQYTEALKPLALRLACAVHDEGPDDVRGALDAIAALPAPPDIKPGEALAVVLAAALNPDKRMSELWGWTESIGGPSKLTPPPAEGGGNPLAIEMALSGALPAKSLNEAEVRQVVRTLIHRGWGEAAIAEHLDVERPVARRWCHNARDHARRESRQGKAA